MIVWGWNRIGKVTASQKALRQIYHQSRYNAAYCYYKYALRLRQPEERNKYLNFGKGCIVDTQRVFPQMGVPRCGQVQCTAQGHSRGIAGEACRVADARPKK